MGNIDFNFSRRPSDRVPGVGSKIGVSAFMLIFLGFGVVFSYLIVREVFGSVKQREWTQVDCVIEQSSVADNHKPSSPLYSLKVAFSYLISGKKFTGTVFRDGYTGSSDYYDSQKLADAYPIGSHHICFVNPADPTHAVLQFKSSVIGFFILIPLIFVLIGAGGIYAVWKPDRAKPASDIAASNQKPPGTSNRKTLFLCSIFAVAGALLLAFWFIPTIQHIRHANSWPEVPCTIIHSGVSTHSSDRGGDTYGVEVLYRYRFNGRDYKSSRYEFITSSSSGYDAKQDIVNALLAHRKTVCYVDPADPEYAVLQRGYSAVLLFGLIPFAFVLFGTIGLISVFRKSATTGTEAVVEKPTGVATPFKKIVAGFFIAAFWNGIVSVFITELISGWQHHHPDYFLAVFLIPFVLVGLGLIGNFFYQVVAALRSSL